MPRYAPAMSQSDLRQIIIDKAIADDFVEDYGEIDRANPEMWRIVHMLLEESLPEVEKDWSKIDFSTENLDVTGELSTPDGVPYIRLRTGGDWESPLVAIIYFDGKKLRGYVPKDGNTYNHRTKAAFGNDDKNDVTDAKKQFGDRLIGSEDHIDVEPDLELIAQDIARRIEARGTHVHQGGKVLSKAAVTAAEQARIEKGQDLSGDITKDMIYAEISPAALGSYVEFKLRSSGRRLKKDEADRVIGVPAQLEKADMGDCILWYAPMECYPMQTLAILEAAGFVKDPKNDLTSYQGVHTYVIRL